jgi:PPK2 family polyphosphate:nucleotide phosphotransferase
MDHDRLIAKPGRPVDLAAFDPAFTGDYRAKEDAARKLRDDIERLAKLQDVFYAQRRYALLIVFQGMDSAGKDGAVKHVMSGVNPQGVDIHAFKTPSDEELDHDFLWRCSTALPARGRIGIFNRSYYEEVLAVRVHPEMLERERIPKRPKPEDLWRERFDDINRFERHLIRDGTLVLKFFLNLSKEEQRRRFLRRLDDPEKNWKFSAADARERKFWTAYSAAYEAAIEQTSTEWAPWYVIPADHKWFSRVAVADVIVEKLRSLRLEYPPTDPAERGLFAAEREELEREGE